MIEDKLKKPQVEITDDDNYEGGIDIKVAQRRMREEDKIDKATFREKIKQRHRVRLSRVLHPFPPHTVVCNITMGECDVTNLYDQTQIHERLTLCGAFG